MQYTFSSTNERQYNTLHVTMPNTFPCTHLNVTVTDLTTNCYIKILSEKDYMTFEYDSVTKTIQFQDYCTLTPDSLASYINDLLEQDSCPISCELDNCSRIKFTADRAFRITAMTYNVKLLIGLYSHKDSEFPFEAVETETNKYALQIESVGFYLSTPILYLVSNIGRGAYRNTTDDIISIQSADIVMRINNSFTHQIPIIASNAEFNQTVSAGALGGVWFKLVDANLHEVELLNPMYLSITVEPAETEFHFTKEDKEVRDQQIAELREEQKKFVYLVWQQQEEWKEQNAAHKMNVLTENGTNPT